VKILLYALTHLPGPILDDVGTLCKVEAHKLAEGFQTSQHAVYGWRNERGITLYIIWREMDIIRKVLSCVRFELLWPPYQGNCCFEHQHLFQYLIVVRPDGMIRLSPIVVPPLTGPWRIY
jgi:hypothetical protein